MLRVIKHAIHWQFYLVKQMRWSRVGVSAAGSTGSAVAAGDLRGDRTVPGTMAMSRGHGCLTTQWVNRWFAHHGW